MDCLLKPMVIIDQGKNRKFPAREIPENTSVQNILRNKGKVMQKEEYLKVLIHGEVMGIHHRCYFPPF